MKKLILVSSFVILVWHTVGAQPGDPGGDPDAVPISGIEILVGLGSLLGVYKLHKNRKAK